MATSLVTLPNIPVSIAGCESDNLWGREWAKLQFGVDPDFLLYEALRAPSAGTHVGEIVDPELLALQNRALLMASDRPGAYQLRRFRRPDIVSFYFSSEGTPDPNWTVKLQETPEFQTVLATTEKFSAELAGVWQSSLPFSQHCLEQITGLEFGTAFSVSVVHPGIIQGQYLGEERIAWGGRLCWDGDPCSWEQRAVVFLWHEVLHAEKYLGVGSTLGHTLIQFAANCELRQKLTAFRYPPFPEGHRHLAGDMERVYPYWQRYLRRPDRNLLEFKELLTAAIGDRPEAAAAA